MKEDRQVPVNKGSTTLHVEGHFGNVGGSSDCEHEWGTLLTFRGGSQGTM